MAQRQVLHQDSHFHHYLLCPDNAQHSYFQTTKGRVYHMYPVTHQSNVHIAVIIEPSVWDLEWNTMGFKGLPVLFICKLSSFGKSALLGWQLAVWRTRSCRGKWSSWRNATCERAHFQFHFILLFMPSTIIEPPFYLLLLVTVLWWSTCVGYRLWSCMGLSNRLRLGPVYWWGA